MRGGLAADPCRQPAPAPATARKAPSTRRSSCGRTDLPPLTCGDTPSELALVDWGNGVLTLRDPDGRYLSVAEDGYVRASADEPGGWIVQETFRWEKVEGHAGGTALCTSERVGTSRLPPTA